MVRSALLIMICLAAAACASRPSPSPRPLASGFGAGSGVADPYTDGKRHLDAGNYEIAVQRFGQALARDGRSLDALNGLAIAYTRLGRFDSAETQLERALQIEPTDAATLNNYGWALIEQGRLREARAFLELARRHATAAEAPVIAINLDKLGHAPPPPLLAALEEGSAAPAPRAPHRLVRVDDNAYLLETPAETAGTAEPAPPRAAAPEMPRAPIADQHERAATRAAEAGAARADPSSAAALAAPGIGAAAALPAPAARARVGAPGPDVPMSRRAGGRPIRLWPPLASGAEAGSTTAGDEQ